MGRVFGFVVSFVLIGASGAHAGARTDSAIPQSSAAQMLQCNSPDPARAVIGCTTLIREANDKACPLRTGSPFASEFVDSRKAVGPTWMIPGPQDELLVRYLAEV